MPAPQPSDPLDHAFKKFVTAVNDYVSMAEVQVEPPEKRPKSGNPFDDIQKGWEDLKQFLARAHKALKGAEAEMDQHLQNITSAGAEVVKLSDDPYIVGHVKDVVQMASDERTDIGNMISRIGAATDIPTVLGLFGEIIGFTPRAAGRRKEMAAALNGVVTYYHLRIPPQSA